MGGHFGYAFSCAVRASLWAPLLGGVGVSEVAPELGGSYLQAEDEGGNIRKKVANCRREGKHQHAEEMGSSTLHCRGLDDASARGM